ncbi:hypothetical protein J6590_013274 [Homalodisca vitripennis]|nr:hypothetical protein J6590_013274 [Homalodisca vitripennis]
MVDNPERSCDARGRMALCQPELTVDSGPCQALRHGAAQRVTGIDNRILRLELLAKDLPVVIKLGNNL